MAKTNWFTVTVSRINESANKDPYVTLEAHTLTLDKEGYLSITGDGEGRSFTAGAYDGFEVKAPRMPPKTGA